MRSPTWPRPPQLGARNNTLGVVTSTFDAVTTTSIRVLASASNDDAYSRIVELGAHAEQVAVGEPIAAASVE